MYVRVFARIIWRAFGARRLAPRGPSGRRPTLGPRTGGTSGPAAAALGAGCCRAPGRLHTHGYTRFCCWYNHNMCILQLCVCVCGYIYIYILDTYYIVVWAAWLLGCLAAPGRPFRLARLANTHLLCSYCVFLAVNICMSINTEITTITTQAAATRCRIRFPAGRPGSPAALHPHRGVPRRPTCVGGCKKNAISFLNVEIQHLAK